MKKYKSSVAKTLSDGQQDPIIIQLCSIFSQIEPEIISTIYFNDFKCNFQATVEALTDISSSAPPPPSSSSTKYGSHIWEPEHEDSLDKARPQQNQSNSKNSSKHPQQQQRQTFVVLAKKQKSKRTDVKVNRDS